MNHEEDRFCSHCGQPLEVNHMWYYAKDEQSHGPYSEEELQDLFVNHVIGIETPVWQEGMEQWVPLKETSMVINKEDVVWFYSIDDQPMGPFSSTHIISLFKENKINEQTQVWKEGMEDWCYLPQSALAQFLPIATDEELGDHFYAQPQTKKVKEKPERSKSMWTIAVLLSLVVVVTLGILMISMFKNNVDQEKAQQEKLQQQQELAAQKEKEEKEKEEEKKKKQEQEEKEKEEKEKENKEKEELLKQQKAINEAARQSLSPYYSNLGIYQVQAQAIEQDFMNNYLKGDVNTRVERYNNAVTLYNTLNTEIANVSYIGVDGNSDYVDDYEALLQCYIDLRDYVGTYVSAWDKDTTYEKPEEHKDELMGIVTNAYGGGDKNASLVDYYNRYAMINLE